MQLYINKYYLFINKFTKKADADQNVVSFMMEQACSFSIPPTPSIFFKYNTIIHSFLKHHQVIAALKAVAVKLKVDIDLDKIILPNIIWCNVPNFSALRGFSGIDSICIYNPLS